LCWLIKFVGYLGFNMLLYCKNFNPIILDSVLGLRFLND